jgi:hypothetical protein
MWISIVEQSKSMLAILKVKRVLDFSSSEEHMPLFVGAAFVVFPL